jgi:hypothetical protein
MLSLLTFEFRIMHFVLMIAVISHIVTDNIIIGLLRCCKYNEKDKPSPLDDDKMCRFGLIRQML